MVLRGMAAALSSLSCPSWIPDFLPRSPWPVLFYPCLHLLSESTSRHTQGQSVRPIPRSPADAALVDLMKLALSIIMTYASVKKPSGVRRNAHVAWNRDRDEEEPLRELPQADSADSVCSREYIEKRSHTEIMRLGSVKSLATIIAAGLLFALQPFLPMRAVDPAVIALGPIFSSILTAYGLYSLLSRSFSQHQFILITLQICGISIAANALTHIDSYSSPFMILLSSSSITALAVILIDFVYQSHEPDCYNTINTILFASGLCIHIVAYAFQLLTPHTSISPHLPHSYNAIAHIALLLVRAFVDYFALFIIYYYNAALERVLASSILPAALVITTASANEISIEFGMGCVVVVWATASYAAGQLSRSHDDIQSPKITEPNPKHRIVGTIVFSALLVSSAYSTVHSRQAPASRFGHSASASAIDHSQTCQRRPLPMAPLQPAEERSYHHFDDVLLIVFFSHARYNVNLDYYRTVYSEYFPNMVFIGPANRENAGFNHSYDVVVDSYKADEDLRDPGYYKMAGRMAHHMLYTGLKEFPCYKGYLWAPFDTLLNVPRLQQFDQNLFWYHSPFAEYVYNPALGFSNKDPEHHPPAAQISPDPALNLTQNWRGWGRDWWWGDPHVGLAACMPAFLRVPLSRRQRLAEYTEGKTRFIGGSADTMYIPGRHREAFMDTLGIFLETDCFLEIATPTALHLVVPPGEKILFVDHWWIWEHPLNATFVRDKWNEGFEVDTFHTFHWGDRDETGVWRGNPAHIADVRELLRESALRQFTNLPASIP